MRTLNTVLDKPENIWEIDRSGMLRDLVKTPTYCSDAIKRADQIEVPREINPENILIAGMGGSAIAGEILRDWLKEKLFLPINVCKDYTLPGYVNKNSLVFVLSYSGNTEETLSIFRAAKQRECNIISITSGGQLKELCKKQQVPKVIIRNGLQPRVALPYLFFPLPILMEKLGILSNVRNELEEAIKNIELICEANAPNIPTHKNKAKQLAIELLDSIPVIYGFRQYSSVAYRLKTQFNENSKIPSKSNYFPEINHNEIVGYEAPKKFFEKQAIILLRDSKEPPEIRKRIEITTDLVFKHVMKILELWAEGEGKLTKMFSVLCMGDFVSVYLAILQNKDPTPVDIITKIKRELTKKSVLNKI